MSNQIRKVAVIGAGVMGKGIAAHLANCGIPSLLLDVKREWVEKALVDLPKMKPGLLYDNADLRLITPGTIEHDLEKVRECDWIVEVIIEQLQPKQELYAKLDALLRPGQIVSSNTSGISWTELSAGRSANFKQHFCITHFFNPVRYLKLVELVGGAETKPAVLSTMHTLLRDTLGKGVVLAKDTPNFIANRIGVHGVMAALHGLKKHGWRVEDVDKVMGPALGRPKSAIFRTADIVGLDTLAHVARNTYESCPADEARELYRLPAFYETMLKDGVLGQKSGKGFYWKTTNAAGESAIVVFDAATGQYREQGKLKTPSLGKAKDMEDLAERMRTIVWADDEAGKIAWSLISETLVYAANRVPEIADDIVSIDRAMEWGFGWEMGPFATWDALGVRQVAERLQRDGRAVPKLVQDLLAAGKEHFYSEARQTLLQSLKAQHRVVQKNDGAVLIDIGDGVFCCEFQTKLNAIDEDIINMLNASLDHVEKSGVGLVIGNEGTNFCVGANLMLIFLEAQEQHWSRIEAIVRQFQALCQRLRFSPKPVVAAPFGLALGGGCEIVLGASAIRAAAETYIGLVELGVGLVPAGAGCKNMLLRAEAMIRAQRKSTDKIWMSPDDGGPFPKVKHAFETIGYAKVATSAKEAQRLGHLRASDRFTIDKDRLITDAKADVLALAPTYQPPAPRDDITLPGKGGYIAACNALQQARDLGGMTEYDQFLGEKLAHILTGSNHPNMHRATEQDILDRECEVFLSLCGEERTHARIQHMLMTGKPLRN